MWIALLVVAAGTATVVRTFDLTSDSSVTSPVPTTTTTTTVDAGLKPDQVRVSGSVTALHVDGAVPDPLALPLTITAPQRGMGNGAEITGVMVVGKPAEIVWDAGRPLVLTSGGALLVDPVAADLTPAGVVLNLGGAVHGFTPGTYRIDAPVAVGQSGLARPKDRVDFDAVKSSALAVHGIGTITLAPPAVVVLHGPGHVSLTGALQATTATGSHPVTKIDLPAGPFEITLTPVPGGYTITALLQGAVKEG
jgi:hypothetical protein